MLQVNRRDIAVSEMEMTWRHYRHMPHLMDPLGKRYALCLSDAAQFVSLALYIRDLGGSILLLHSSTPFETAKLIAEEAGCTGLIYNDSEQFFACSEERVVKDSIARIYQYSSGTTGHAKLIGRSWEAVNEEIEAYNEAIELEKSCTPIVLAPVSHSYGLICGVLASFARGSKPIIISNANPKLTLSLLREMPDHIIYGVPTQLQALAALGESRLKLGRLMSSGMPMSVKQYEQFSQFGSMLMQQYGCTEAGCISVSTSMQSPHDLGKPLRKWTVHTSRSMSNEAEEFKPDTPAELVAVSKEQSIWTGDLGIVKADGSLSFVARLDDVINVSGLKVYPLEVEEVIAAMPGIKENVIYRGSHSISGDKVKCLVVAERSISAEAIREWCSKRLPAYKVPMEVSFVTEIPKSATGKVSRRQLEREEAVQ